MSADTPLMRQYKEIKDENRDAVLLFRLGDFYEMFFEDAKIASKELGITLTSRNKEKGVDVPLAGFPYHSAAQYIAKLVSKGYKVAVCEQVEDPKSAKGIVKREVTKRITPGTVIDTDYLDEKSNNYIVAVKAGKEEIAIAYADITTGEFLTSQFESGENGKLLGELYKILPKEIITDSATAEILREEFESYKLVQNSVINIIDKIIKDAENFIKDYFRIVSLESYGITGKNGAVNCCAMLLEYILELHNYGELPFKKLSYVNSEKYMELNFSTQRNLELTALNSRDSGTEGTLLWVIDSTKTAMGGRMLKKNIKKPLIDIAEIEKRLNHTSYFITNIIEREEVKEELKNIYDIERLIGKIVLGTENGRDLIAIKKSCESVLKIKEILSDKSFFEFSEFKIREIAEKIERAVVEEPPFSIREGGIIKGRISSELDELHRISANGKEMLLEIEVKERERTGIKSLKVRYNKVFGYYIEISNSNREMIPDDYIRKQTLSNAERFVTAELKEYEAKILTAKERIEAIEYEIFKELTREIAGSIEVLQQCADETAYVDMILSFSECSVRNGYIRPELTQDYELVIEEGRHPIVEKLIGHNSFVKNGIEMKQDERFIILTGPNMAGKSTYMKQSAMIIIMAQIGCYVPAKYAKIGVVDKIFTRIGASDDIVSGQSTFMVEMSEVANIVNSATERSFIILDEVGRGTSTFDGISIAWAISEYIHDHLKAKTIFATHYHELTDMEKKYKNAVNYRIEVKEKEDSVIFLRKIVRGGADKSYGIEVARLAGLPDEILTNSRKILKSLEARRAIIEKKIKGEQLTLFGELSQKSEEEEKEERINELRDKIYLAVMELDVENMTPIEALLKLNQLKKESSFD